MRTEMTEGYTPVAHDVAAPLAWQVQQVGGSSPWGAVQTVERLIVPHRVELAGGGVGVCEVPIFVVSTASHGGIYVPSALLGSMPWAYRQYAKKWSGSENWFEEDCAVLAVVVSFPEAFPSVNSEKRERLRQTIDGLVERSRREAELEALVEGTIRSCWKA